MSVAFSVTNETQKQQICTILNLEEIFDKRKLKNLRCEKIVEQKELLDMLLQKVPFHNI